VSKEITMTIAMVTQEQAGPKPDKRDGSPGRGLMYFDPPRDDRSPQGFTAEVFNDTLGAHFHTVDQFQVLFGTPGSMFRRTPIPDLFIHYADAYVTYGPLIGEDPPLRFFSLRARPSAGTWFMPESRDHLAYRGKRHMQATPASFDIDTPLADGEIQEEIVFEDLTDGLEARVITAGPHAALMVEPSTASSGQYMLVVDGEVEIEGKTYGRESLGWQQPDDPPAKLTAGSQGCRVVVTRFPYPETPAAHPEVAS
jgi:hypothetical protein